VFKDYVQMTNCSYRKIMQYSWPTRPQMANSITL